MPLLVRHIDACPVLRPHEGAALRFGHFMRMCVPVGNSAVTGGMPPKRSQAAPFAVEETCLRYYWAERTFASTVSSGIRT